MKRLLFLALLIPQLARAAVQFDGTDDAFVLDNINVPSQTYTVCFWINQANILDDHAVTSYGNGSFTGSGRGWNVRGLNASATTGSYRLGIHSGASNQQRNTANMDEAVWSHVCVTRSGNFNNMSYVDGVETNYGALDLPPTIQDATDDFFVGKTINGQGHTDFNGSLAHLAYWNEVLTAGEIASLADKSTCPLLLSGKAPDVFLEFPESGSILDTSANAFTVTTEGNPTQVAGPTSLPSCSTGPSMMLKLYAIGENDS